MKTDKTKISKLISYWLRHHPEDADLIVDEFGWTNIDDLLDALREKKMIRLSLEELLELNQSFDKIRYEIDTKNGKIKATHGHSIPVIIDQKPHLPPKFLLHGTSVDSIRSIFKEGLRSMKRHFVHLSENVETALETGRRHGKGVIIKIRTQDLVVDDWLFYKTGDMIWLTKDIPARHISFDPWQQVLDPYERVVHYKALQKELSHDHALINIIDTLELKMKRTDCDDPLFVDYESGKYYSIHLTRPDNFKPNSHWPEYEEYTSLDQWIREGLTADQKTWYEY